VIAFHRDRPRATDKTAMHPHGAIVLLVALATLPRQTGHAQEAAVRDAASIPPSRCVSGEMPDEADIEGPAKPEARDRIVVERCEGISQLVVLDGVRAPVGLQCYRPVDGRYIDCAELGTLVLATLIASYPVRCSIIAGSRAECFVPSATGWLSLNRMMVRAGMARASAAAYAQAEADGRNDETGLWDKEIYRDGGGWWRSVGDGGRKYQ
jgi:hypothetical protein